MNKEVKEALEMLYLLTAPIREVDKKYVESLNNTIKQHISRLEKHKNELGDLLAKREEQLDKIKEVLDIEVHDYNKNTPNVLIKELIKILEED